MLCNGWLCLILLLRCFVHLTKCISILKHKIIFYCFLFIFKRCRENCYELYSVIIDIQRIFFLFVSLFLIITFPGIQKGLENDIMSICVAAPRNKTLQEMVPCLEPSIPYLLSLRGGHLEFQNFKYRSLYCYCERYDALCVYLSYNFPCQWCACKFCMNFFQGHHDKQANKNLG